MCWQYVFVITCVCTVHVFIVCSELCAFMIIEAVMRGDNDGCTYSIFSLHPRKHNRICMHVLSLENINYDKKLEIKVKVNYLLQF